MILEAVLNDRLSLVTEITCLAERLCPSPILMFEMPRDVQEGVSQFELDRWADDGGPPARDED